LAGLNGWTCADPVAILGKPGSAIEPCCGIVHRTREKADEHSQELDRVIVSDDGIIPIKAHRRWGKVVLGWR